MSVIPPTPALALQQQSPGSSSSAFPGPRIEEADDSIVLSDLVRTGEASRLRRRGAMRVDRHSLHRIHPPARRPGIFIEDSDSEDDYRPYSSAYGEILDRRHRSFTSYQYQYPSYSRLVAEPEGSGSDDSTPYILVCGATVEDQPPQQKHYAPFEPSLFPLMPGEASSSSRAESPSPPPTTNGCGSIIHYRGSCPQPQAIIKTYTARSRAADIVVPLEAEYFSTHVAKTFETSPCGCVKEGIGCAVCGNLLGTRWRFCPRMAESRKPPSQRRRGLPAELDPELDLELYTFFYDAVSGHPDPTYEAPSSSQAASEPTSSSSPFPSAQFVSPASPHRRTTWVPDDSDSDSENEIEFAQIVTEAREVRISDVQGSSSRFHWNRPALVVNVGPPIVHRQRTASPEPFISADLDADGNETGRPFESLMDALRHDSTVVVADSPLSILPRGTQPEPQPMSFYEQQVLGAWERERDQQNAHSRSARDAEVSVPWYEPHDEMSRRDSVEVPSAAEENIAFWVGASSRS